MMKISAFFLPSLPSFPFFFSIFSFFSPFFPNFSPFPPTCLIPIYAFYDFTCLCIHDALREYIMTAAKLHVYYNWLDFLHPWFAFTQWELWLEHNMQTYRLCHSDMYVHMYTWWRCTCTCMKSHIHIPYHEPVEVAVVSDEWVQTAMQEQRLWDPPVWSNLSPLKWAVQRSAGWRGQPYWNPAVSLVEQKQTQTAAVHQQLMTGWGPDIAENMYWRIEK